MKSRPSDRGLLPPLPFAFRRVIDAMCPWRDSSAATKYSPETPDRMPEMVFRMGLHVPSSLSFDSSGEDLKS